MENQAELILLICHFDNREGLIASIKSIDEVFPVDILIVDDGSSSKPNLTELKSIYNHGEIYLEILSQNQGVGKATNIGLEKILEWGYKFTGRLDCGDLVHKNKFQKQFLYLKENPDVKMLGTWVNMVDTQGKVLFVLKHPVSYPEIQKYIYLNSTFVNSSTIFYTEILKTVGLFPEKYRRNGEDYAFFFNVVEKFNSENLPEVLLDYEINPNSLSTKGRKDQVRARINIIKDHFHLGIYPVYGLLRSFVLLYMSRNATIFLKKRLFKR
jgi:glycosyltransferase involved in cell wall biosynthesis